MVRNTEHNDKDIKKGLYLVQSQNDIIVDSNIYLYTYTSIVILHST